MISIALSIPSTSGTTKATITYEFTGKDGQPLGGTQKKIAYAYKCREEEIEGADSVEAVIPPIETKVSMRTNDETATGYVREGYAFSPMFTLGYKTTLKDKEVVSTWLKLEKAN